LKIHIYLTENCVLQLPVLRKGKQLLLPSGTCKRLKIYYLCLSFLQHLVDNYLSLLWYGVTDVFEPFIYFKVILAFLHTKHNFDGHK